jgi:hypothetical protein
MNKAHVVVGQIERMERIVDASDMPDASKTLTTDLLMSAKEAQNGAPDKLDAMARTLGYISVHIAAAEKRHHEDQKKTNDSIAQAVALHTTNCPLATGKGLGKVAKWIAILKPVAWPLCVFLCVGAMSPYVGPVLAAFFHKVTQ